MIHHEVIQRATALSGWLIALVVCFTSTADGAKQPNIILLLADDLGYGELGCQGNPQIPTPHIDSIAKGGVRFTQAYVTAPNCSPSRAGLLTGQWPQRFGYEFNPIGARNEDPETGLPPATQTIAELLHDGGYTTGLVGKWHLGGAADFHPRRHGFDEFFGFTHEGHFFVPPPYDGVTTMLRRKTLPRRGSQEDHPTRWISERLIYTNHMGHDEPRYDANNPIVRDGQPVEERAYLTDAFTREACGFIDRHADKPFFLHVAYNAVHSPLQGQDEYMRKFAHIEDVHRRIFAAMLANLDDSVGEILAKVRDKGIAENTLVIFLSDNGGPTKELTSSNAPLRGGKGTMYEGGLRVPCLMQWPGTLPSGKVVDGPICTVDFLPTMAAIADAKPRAKSDGVNLLPLLTSDDAWPRDRRFYWRQGPKSAYREGDWKLVMWRQKNDARRIEIYNVSADKEEAHDRAAWEQERINAMLSRFQQLDKQMQPPRFK